MCTRFLGFHPMNQKSTCRPKPKNQGTPQVPRARPMLPEGGRTAGTTRRLGMGPRRLYTYNIIGMHDKHL